MSMNAPKSNPAGSTSEPVAPVRTPNEAGTIRVEAHMRIFDPKTGQTLVEGRA